jgi:hypothetical protein
MMQGVSDEKALCVSYSKRFVTIYSQKTSQSFVTILYLDDPHRLHLKINKRYAAPRELDLIVITADGEDLEVRVDGRVMCRAEFTEFILTEARHQLS